MYERDGWKRTDTYSFTAPCETPTTYAIEAVDSEGVAAVIANFVHCGEGTHTDENWVCGDHQGHNLGSRWRPPRRLDVRLVPGGRALS